MIVVSREQPVISEVRSKFEAGERLSFEDGLYLSRPEASLGEVAALKKTPVPFISLVIVAVAWLAIFSRCASAAEGADPVMLAAIGDDDSDFVLFGHVADPTRPTRLRFVGSAESRQTFYNYPIGIALAFGVPVGEFGFDFFPESRHYTFELPQPAVDGAFVRVPIDISYELPYSPERVGLFVEGFGPDDNSVIEGTFYHTVVPEPSGMGLALGCLAMGIPWLLRRERRWRRGWKERGG